MRQNSLFDNEIKSRLYGEEFKEASRQKIIAQVEMYNSDETALFWEALRVIKKEFIEEHLRLDFSHFIFPSFESTQLTGGGIPKKARESFNFWEEGESVAFHQELSFKKCYFTGDVNFQSTLFKKTTTFFGTQFRKESEFYHTTFLKDVRFDEAGFHGRTVFHKTSFKGKSSVHKYL
jgi:hypothetical protein